MMCSELRIKISPAGWSWKGLQKPAFHLRRVRLVATSASSQIWRHCQPRSLDEIVVDFRTDGPVCDFKRDSKARIRVGLCTKPNSYDQLAYQFAHEFCHVIANHSRGGQHHDASHANQWLEESLCEAASIFALKNMTDEWNNHREFATWKTGDNNTYYPCLLAYAQGILESTKERLPDGGDFQAWFEGRRQFLQSNPIALQDNKQVKEELRNDFKVIATRLLPLLEANPENWDSVSYLNFAPSNNYLTLADHLTAWKAACPDKHLKFVESVESLFLLSSESNCREE